MLGGKGRNALVRYGVWIVLEKGVSRAKRVGLFWLEAVEPIEQRNRRRYLGLLQNVPPKLA
jgi:hypothetical protein